MAPVARRSGSDTCSSRTPACSHVVAIADRGGAQGERRRRRATPAPACRWSRRGDRLEARGHRRRERAPVLHDGAGTEHADQRAHRAAGPQIGLQLVEQRVGCGGAPQERRATVRAPRRGRGRRPRAAGRAAGHLGVAIEQGSPSGSPRGDAQRPGHDVDATLALLVDAVAQRHSTPRSRSPCRRTHRRGCRRRGRRTAGRRRRRARPRGPRPRRRSSAMGSAEPPPRRWHAAAQLLAADALDEVVGVGVLGDDGVGPVEQAPGRRGHPGVEHRRRRRAATAGPGRRAPARAGWPAPTSGPRVAGAPRWFVTTAPPPRAPGRRPRRGRPRRAPGARRGPGSPTGNVAGERPVGGASVGAGRVVVGGRAHQRVAEREAVAVEDRRRRAPRRPPARRRPRSCSRRALMMRTRSPSGSAAATSRALEDGGGSRSQQEVDDALARRPDRQRIGQLGPPGALVGVEHVGRLDEHERDAAAGGDQLAADVRRGHAGVAEDGVGDVVGHRVEDDDRAGVGVARRHPAAGSTRWRGARTAAAGRCRTACGASAGRPTAGRRRGRRSARPRPRRRAGHASPGRWRTARRAGRCPRGRAWRARPRRVPGRGGRRPSSTPSSSSARPDQASSTSASTPRRRRMRQSGWSARISVGRLVDDGRLADAGLADDGQRPALPDGGTGGEAGDGVDDVLAAVQRRDGASAGGSGSVIVAAGQHGVSPMPARRSGPQTNRRIFGASRSQAVGGRIGTESTMGAGARFAAERDRWPEHWQLADLDRGGGRPARAAGAGGGAARGHPGDAVDVRRRRGAGPDRRHRSAGRRSSSRRPARTSRAVAGDRRHGACASTAPRWSRRSSPHVDGHARVRRRRGRHLAPVGARSTTVDPAPPERPGRLCARAPSGAAERRTQPRRCARRIAVTAPPSAWPLRRLHHGADERADRLVLAGRGTSSQAPALAAIASSTSASRAPSVHRLEALRRGDRRGVAAAGGDELGEHRLGLRRGQRAVDLERRRARRGRRPARPARRPGRRRPP